MKLCMVVSNWSANVYHASKNYRMNYITVLAKREFEKKSAMDIILNYSFQQTHVIIFNAEQALTL